MSAAANPVRQAVLWLNDPLNWTNPGASWTGSAST